MSADVAHDRWGQPDRIPAQPTAGRPGESSCSAASPQTVLVCDDWPQVRAAITAVVADLSAFRVVGEAADSVSCLERVAELHPDVLILDVSIPGGGAEVARMAKRLQPGLHIVVYSGRQDRRTQREMLAAGADQYVVKTGRVRPLVEALENAVATPARTAQGA